MKHCDKIYADMLNDLGELISLDSLLAPSKLNAPFGEKMRTTLDWFITKAKSYGLTAYEKDGYYGVVEIGDNNSTLNNSKASDKNNKMFAFAGHLDVVEAGSSWTVPPFALTNKDGYLYGRGVVDNKGPAIAVLHVLKALKDSSQKLNHRIRLIVGCNEESGSLCLKKYAEVDEIPAFTLIPDADFPVIYSEKGIMFLELTKEMSNDFCKRVSELSFGGANLNMIPARACAVLDGKEIITTGVAGHAMAPELGDNASWKLFSELSGVSADARLIYDLFCNHNAKKILDIDYNDEVSGELTMSLNKGELIGKNLKLTFDMRLPICADKDLIISKLEKTFGAKSKVIAYKENLYIDPDSKLVQTLLNIYQKQTGDLESQPKKIGGGTYARELPNAIAFGAQFDRYESNIHNADEKVSVEHFNKWFDIYYNTVLELDCM